MSGSPSSRSLAEARSALAFEFPYALEAIDFALADLFVRTTIHLRPILLLGDVGGDGSAAA
jgi:ATP-dependent Lon protease